MADLSTGKWNKHRMDGNFWRAGNRRRCFRLDLGLPTVSLRRLLLGWALLLAGLCCLLQAPSSSRAYWQSRAQVVTAGGAACGGYSGPGDVVGGALAAWSLRAYNAADCGNKLINACNSTGGVDVACADIASSATTGALVPQTIGGITCPGTNCTIKTWYDRSGANACSGGVPSDMVQATVASRAALTASLYGSFPAAVFSGAQSYTPTCTNTQAIPISVSTVVNHNNSTATFGFFWDDQVHVGLAFLFVTGSGRVIPYQNGPLIATAPLNTDLSIEGVLNGVSSAAYVNGTSTTGNAGSNTGMSGNTMIIGQVGGAANFYIGNSPEIVIYPVALNSIQAGNLTTNKRAFWGF